MFCKDPIGVQINPERINKPISTQINQGKLAREMIGVPIKNNNHIARKTLLEKVLKLLTCIMSIKKRMLNYFMIIFCT